MDKNIKILIVDPLSVMRSIVKKQLADIGFANTMEANDGKHAWPMLQGGDYDFVITDRNMPAMGGIDLLRAIRADERLQRLPVMMVSADAEREQIVDAVNAGVNGYLVKPFNGLALRERIERIFSAGGVGSMNSRTSSPLEQG